MSILPGLFVIEGIDGSGKTTLGESLARAIPEAEYTMQPSDGPVGQKIRSILRHKEPTTPEALLFLFLEDRKEHQEYIRERILGKHQMLILDRYVLSTLAYQGLDFSTKDLWEKNRDFFIPQITFFLEIPVEVAFQRKISQISGNGKPDLYEVKEKQEKILKNYAEAIPFLEKKGYRIIRIDGRKEIFDLVEECLGWIEKSKGDRA